MNAPLITIGLTAFDAKDTVQRALCSALAQTWRPIEIVVVDDCSTDGTCELLYSMSKQHPEMRIYVNSVNSGVAFSRNRILSEARGEFVAFFDDDDESHPDRLSKQYMRITQYESMYSNGEPVICHTARRLIYPDGKECLSPTMGEKEGVPAPSGIAVAKRILLGEPLKDGNGACPTSSQMARLSTYQNIGGFDPELRRSEDTDFNIRLALSGGHFLGIKDPLVVQTMTKTYEKSLREEFRNISLLIEKHKNVFDNNKIYRFTRTWLGIKQKWLEKKRITFIFSLALLAIHHPIMTYKRFIAALPNVRSNRAFSRFYNQKTGSV